MGHVFVYGTLRHVPLLEIVLDRPCSTIAMQPARLPDISVFWALQGVFPMIKKTTGRDAEGLLLTDLDDADIKRLDFYESGYGYALQASVLRSGEKAQVYFPPVSGVTAGEPWDLRAWERENAELTCLAAKEVMLYMSERTPQEVVQMYPMIRARAASELMAKEVRHGAGTLRGKVNVLKRERKYSDYFALDVLTLDHERFDGRMSDTLSRAVFIGTDAAIVLPYDARRDQVLLVEQFRVGPIGRGDPYPWQLEPISGRVDPGETPKECALREAHEEAGLSIQKLLPVAESYPSPGTSSEFYHVYIGLADLSANLPTYSGLEAEDEDIKTHVMSFDDLMALVDEQRVANIPLVLCAYWLARYRAQGATLD